MTLNMDDDLDMSMRAPYISMSESSELPMLIAEDLMWGAQPDLKQTLNVQKKAELANSLPDNVDSQLKANGTYNQQQTKSTMESSLAALLCNQLLQHHQQQQMAEQQMNQSQSQIIMNSNPSVKIQLMDQEGNMSISNAGALMVQTEETGLLALSPSLSLDWRISFIFSFRAHRMDDEWSFVVEKAAVGDIESREVRWLGHICLSNK